MSDNNTYGFFLRKSFKRKLGGLYLNFKFLIQPLPKIFQSQVQIQKHMLYLFWISEARCNRKMQQNYRITWGLTLFTVARRRQHSSFKCRTATFLLPKKEFQKIATYPENSGSRWEFPSPLLQWQAFIYLFGLSIVLRRTPNPTGSC